MALEPRTLSGAWQSDCQHHHTFGRTWRGRGNRGGFSAGATAGWLGVWPSASSGSVASGISSSVASADGAEWSLSPQREQKLEPQLAHVLDHPALVRRGADDFDRLRSESRAPVCVAAHCGFGRRSLGIGLATGSDRSSWRNSVFRLIRTLVGACDAKFPTRSQIRRSGASWRQNKPAVKEEERVDRMSLRESFCDAAGGRASIYACKAFNTEESAGSIREPAEEPAPIAAQMSGRMHRGFHIGATRMADMAETNSTHHSRPEIHLSDDGSQERNESRYASMVRGGQRQALRDDAQHMGKVKRIRNNPLVRVAPCTMRGRVTGDRALLRTRAFCRRKSMCTRVRPSTGSIGQHDCR